MRNPDFHQGVTAPEIILEENVVEKRTALEIATLEHAVDPSFANEQARLVAEEEVTKVESRLGDYILSQYDATYDASHDDPEY